MRGRKDVIIAAFAVTPILVQCAPARPVVVTKDDAGRIIAARPGEPITINLEANPSTGYAWRVMEERNASVAQPIETKRDGEVPKGMVGAPEMASIKVTVLDAGSASVMLGYAPAYDQQAKPDQMLRFRFEAK